MLPDLAFSMAMTAKSAFPSITDIRVRSKVEQGTISIVSSLKYCLAATS